MGYIYHHLQSNTKTNVEHDRQTLRCNVSFPIKDASCDPMFLDAWIFTQRELEPMLKDVRILVANSLSSQRPKRKRKVLNQFGYDY